MNALIATVIVIGRRDRVDEAAAALDEARDRGAVRRVLISEGTETTTSFLLAPALGLLVEDAPDDPLGPDTAAFVFEITWRTQAVRSAPPRLPPS